jgi:hypothetical protein
MHGLCAVLCGYPTTPANHRANKSGISSQRFKECGRERKCVILCSCVFLCTFSLGVLGGAAGVEWSGLVALSTGRHACQPVSGQAAAFIFAAHELARPACGASAWCCAWTSCISFSAYACFETWVLVLHLTHIGPHVPCKSGFVCPTTVNSMPCIVETTNWQVTNNIDIDCFYHWVNVKLTHTGARVSCKVTFNSTLVFKM